VSFVVSIILTSVFTMLSALAAVMPFNNPIFGGLQGRPGPPSTPPWEVYGTDKLTFVLLGYDSVDEWAHRSDTLMIGAVDFYAATVKIVSLPRDTLVYIPRHGFTKVNSAYAFGGEDLVRQTMENFTGVPIDYVISVNYDGFRQVVDALGGVDIDVEKDMNYDDRRGFTHIHIPAGFHHFNGEQALNYARFRHDAMGDLGRIERQQALMRALFEQRIRPGNLLNFKPAADAFLNNITVSVNPDSPRNPPEIGFTEIMSLVGFLTMLDSEEIQFYQIPTDDVTWEGLSCLVPLYDRTREMLGEVFRDDGGIAWEMEDPGAVTDQTIRMPGSTETVEDIQ
jgi:LCP family protein required for cell wall assembly